MVFNPRGSGCRVPPTSEPDWVCPASAQEVFTIELRVTVTEPSGTIPDGYAQPTPSRWVPSADGTAMLPNEIGIVASEAATPSSIGGLVESLGGGLTSADAAIGLYQARFATKPPL